MNNALNGILSVLAAASCLAAQAASMEHVALEVEYPAAMAKWWTENLGFKVTLARPSGSMFLEDEAGRGTFGNAGQNLYVSKAGVLQRIYQYDLDKNGYFDLVFANCQDHHESAPSYVYALDGKRTASRKCPSYSDI